MVLESVVVLEIISSPVLVIIERDGVLLLVVDVDFWLVWRPSHAAFSGCFPGVFVERDNGVHFVSTSVKK